MGVEFSKKWDGSGGGGGGGWGEEGVTFFPIKIGAGKIVEVTLSSVIFLSVWCVFVLFIYTISMSFICVSHEECSLITSNQQDI